MNYVLVSALRQRGVDVMTVLDAGLLGTADDEHLQIATDEGRVLYSFNICDFCAIHSKWVASGRNHSGIILAVQTQFSVGEQMRRLLRLIAGKTAESMCNQLEFLSAWS